MPRYAPPDGPPPRPRAIAGVVARPFTLADAKEVLSPRPPDDPAKARALLGEMTAGRLHVIHLPARSNIYAGKIEGKVACCDQFVPDVGPDGAQRKADAIPGIVFAVNALRWAYSEEGVEALARLIEANAHKTGYPDKTVRAILSALASAGLSTGEGR